MAPNIPHRLTSEMWNHFSIISRNEKIGCCKYCLHKFSYKSSISNLKRHLEHKHPHVEISAVIPKPPKSPPDTKVHVSDNNTMEVPIEMKGLGALDDNSMFSGSSDSHNPQPSPPRSIAPARRFPRRHGHSPSSSSKKKLFSLAATTLETFNAAPQCALDDEFSIAGKKYAYDLKTLNVEQRIIVEKIVSEVLFHAKRNKLTASSSFHLEITPEAQTSYIQY